VLIAPLAPRGSRLEAAYFVVTRGGKNASAPFSSTQLAAGPVLATLVQFVVQFVEARWCAIRYLVAPFAALYFKFWSG
jgi:hypothetical protein